MEVGPPAQEVTHTAPEQKHAQRLLVRGLQQVVEAVAEGGRTNVGGGGLG